MKVVPSISSLFFAFAFWLAPAKLTAQTDSGRSLNLSEHTVALFSVDLNYIRSLEEFRFIPWNMIDYLTSTKWNISLGTFKAMDVAIMNSTSSPEFVIELHNESGWGIASVKSSALDGVRSSSNRPDLKYRKVKGTKLRLVETLEKRIFLGTDQALRQMVNPANRQPRLTEIVNREKAAMSFAISVEPVRPQIIYVVNELKKGMPDRLADAVSILANEVAAITWTPSKPDNHSTELRYMDFRIYGNSLKSRDRISLAMAILQSFPAEQWHLILQTIVEVCMPYASASIRGHIVSHLLTILESSPKNFMEFEDHLLVTVEVPAWQSLVGVGLAAMLPLLDAPTEQVSPMAQTAQHAIQNPQASNSSDLERDIDVSRTPLGGGLSEHTKERVSDAALAASRDKMKQILLGMHQHESAFKKFPPRFSRDDSGKPLLSWRVTILKELDEGALYNKFRLDEPWDSPHNRQLIEEIPSCYVNPRSNAPKGYTTYVIPYGNNSFGSFDTGIQMRQIVDGTSNTIALVEVDSKYAVPWTAPEDIDVEKQSLQIYLPVESFECNIGLADGSVAPIRQSNDPDLWKAMLTIDGGEFVKFR